ncbi:unnamed protein product [Hermetia illucens]|uniref:Vacuolar protein-sorting-associated protein 36 n=1 Tax=Hermetia illucens TaxID=343691 RepID=A0A7R8UI03_HERIL|nr:vacuolar protein-sorting-associated protein 36 [Hermetia illucens]CAD7080989.1 unnamed protein product [Hermetia illucens]
MNRFEYQQAKLAEDEQFVSKDKAIKLYDGDEKTAYEDGEVVLTTHRLFWGRPGEIARGSTTLCLQLQYIVGLDEEVASSFVFGKKKRLILNLRPLLPGKLPGPMENSTAHFVKLSGRHGLDPAFMQAIRGTLEARIWLIPGDASGSNASPSRENAPRIQLRTGIGGIERAIEAKQKATDDSIAIAFQDLKALMAMAQDMVSISKSISSKIRERKGEISEDETVQFKSYLMSMGIDDPVTRESFTSNTEYFKSLARQICEMILDPMEEAGGMMSLADVYCRVNRARGLELLSPEDLLNACKFLDGPIKLRTFPSGAMVLQLESQDEEIIAKEVGEKVEEAKSLSVEDLAKILGISILLSKEHLLAAERLGIVCRDESIEGLRFYPNLFLR